MEQHNDNKTCIKVRLLASRSGDYKTLVFLDLDSGWNTIPAPTANKYIMCTVLPNWENHDQMKNGQEGYLTYRNVKAGDSFYNSNTGSYEFYKYTANYFEDFVPITHMISTNVLNGQGGIIIS